MAYAQQAKTLFQLQTELVDAKVDIAVNKSISDVHRSISQVVEQILNLRQEVSGLRQEMHHEISGLRQEMHREITSVKDELRQEIAILTKDMSAVKERLGMRTGTRTMIWSNLINHSFHTGWLVAIAVISYALGHTHTLFP